MNQHDDDQSTRDPSPSKPFYGQDPHEIDFLEGISRSTEHDLEPEEPIGVGERIRKLRELKKLSLGDVAQRSGISKQMLESIEADATAPPLGTLTKLARALEMKMGYLLTAGEPKPFVITRKDERKPVSRHAAEQQKNMAIHTCLCPPGCETARWNRSW